MKRLLSLAVLLVACGRTDSARLAITPVDTVIAVNGTRLFVHREGRGDPMIVIHGGPLLDHGHLVEPLRPLGDDVDLIFYDQRLSGRSAGTVDSASVRLDVFAEDVDAIRAAFGFDRVHVLGHSWGGLIAMRYATTFPDRVRSLILVSPMPPTARLWQDAEQALASSLTAEDTAGMGALRASEGITAGRPEAIEELLRLSFRSQVHDPADAATLRFHIEPDYGERSRQFGLILRDLTGYDEREALRSLDVPVLILYGASETAARAGTDTLAATLPHARVTAIPETGHFAFIERPEPVLDAIRGHLRRLH